MRSGNNIHVQQHKTNMINEEWNKTQNDDFFVAFYDMRVVTFVLPDEMADVSIAGLQSFILLPRLNHEVSQANRFPFQTLFTSRKKKKKKLEQELPSLLQSYELRGSSPSSLILVATYDMP